ncbi:hypothetical protein GQ55_3G110800 [Panicum hallii var. hallii]|uniref:Uncharacterized protein n=1 Tax=Panicum hallii var. hallii TaxID=1504633 RepID=A0A2T7E867_9POAL|nr:hypothetical protein GQ55_3G110800 [Panicum hallii var. hallii]
MASGSRVLCRSRRRRVRGQGSRRRPGPGCSGWRRRRGGSWRAQARRPPRGVLGALERVRGRLSLLAAALACRNARLGIRRRAAAGVAKEAADEAGLFGSADASPKDAAPLATSAVVLTCLAALRPIPPLPAAVRSPSSPSIASFPTAHA